MKGMKRKPVSLLPPRPYGGFGYEHEPWPMETEVIEEWNRLTPVLEVIEMACYEWIMLKWPPEPLK